MEKSKEKESDEREKKSTDSSDEDAAGPSLEKPDSEDSVMLMLRKRFGPSFKLFDFSESSESPKEKRVLPSLDLDGIVKYIKEQPRLKIITMAGAGISTSAGIPDFRSPASGLYHNLVKYNLPYPQAIFELDFFVKNPEPFFCLAKELLPGAYEPTPCHYFIRLLWEKGLLIRHYTQNVDTLERIAGLPNNKVVEAHGSFHTGHCLKCRALHTLEQMKEKIMEGLVPKCNECKEGIVKPDIVFFGEMLPALHQSLVDKDFPEANLLIVLGSSLVVRPFSYLIDRVDSTCPRLLINKEKVGMQNPVERFFGMNEGFVFDPKNPELGRDVAWLGDCDTGCQLLADKLGWGDELRALVVKEHERLRAELTISDSVKIN